MNSIIFNFFFIKFAQINTKIVIMKRIGLIAIIIFSAFFAEKTEAQTAGSLTFSFAATEPSGNYTNAIVLAIWIENSSGTFIKTKMRYAGIRKQYLNVWISKSSENVVDATTGATCGLGTKSITWNGTNVSGTLVPDGTYKVWIQMSDKNSNGPTASLTFTKGATADHQTGATGNFTNMVLDWTPLGVGIAESVSGDLSVKCFPNPFSTETTIDYTLENPSTVSISVYDLQGNLVKTLVDSEESYGNNSITWSATSDIAPGAYYVSIKTGTNSIVKKVLLTK